MPSRWGTDPPALGPLALGEMALDHRRLRPPGPTLVLSEWPLQPFSIPGLGVEKFTPYHTGQ